MEALCEFLHPPGSSEAALALLAPPVRTWFVQRFGTPTLAQRHAWPAVAAGKNLLLAAPTGSGKTLAACLPILSSLRESAVRGAVRCLYVAPLKALLGDVRLALRRALREMRQLDPETSGFLRVGLRTGDTSTRQRQEFRRRPPDLLLTTPESLALLLGQPAGAEVLAAVRWIIVDEIHALVGSKRGVDLALSLERLTDLTAQAPQRVGLSATCAPLKEAARFLVGTERPCAIAEVHDSSPLQLLVEPLAEASAQSQAAGFIARLVERLEPEIREHATTLIFTNTRRLAERLTWSLRRRLPQWAHAIAVHHSSLAAVRRRVVERAMKRGRLRAVVTSTSLELGIDIGSVDQVVLVHPPGGVVRLLQRVGRSGHGPARTRCGLILTASPAELCEAAVTCAAGHAAQAEPVPPLVAPLDVLCQQLLGMAALRAWMPDEAFTLVRRAFPYRHLTRADFDACVDYLSGRRRDGTSWLPARLDWEEGRFAILDRRTARILWRNLGTILSEEPRAVVQETDGLEDFPRQTLIGHVDEAYADRLQAGDRFVLDGRCLEVRQTGSQVIVHEVLAKPTFPQWAGSEWPLTPELAQRLYLLRVRAAEALRDGPMALEHLLGREYGLQGMALRDLAEFFEQQERLSEIPDNTTCLVEEVRVSGGGEYYVHTPLNRAGNDALVRAVVHRLTRDHGRSAASLTADLGFALFLCGPTPLAPDLLNAVLSLDRFEADLHEAIADSVTLRERFHRAALIGLMLLRNPLGGRQRVGGQDWAERRLFEQVRAADPEFVLLRQATREVLHECCDVQTAQGFLQERSRRTLRWRRLTAVSPFAVSWSQVLAGPVGVTESPTDALERLHQHLTGEHVHAGRS